MLHFWDKQNGFWGIILRHLLFLFLSVFVWTDRQKTYIDTLVCLSMPICLYMSLSMPKKNPKNDLAVLPIPSEKLNLAKINFT